MGLVFCGITTYFGFIGYYTYNIYMITQYTNHPWNFNSQSWKKIWYYIFPIKKFCETKVHSQQQLMQQYVLRSFSWHASRQRPNFHFHCKYHHKWNLNSRDIMYIPWWNIYLVFLEKRIALSLSKNQMFMFEEYPYFFPFSFSATIFSPIECPRNKK